MAWRATAVETKALLLAVALIFLPGQQAWAAGGLGVDARFDLTNDGIVDASDWKRMTEDARRAYANESVRAMGEDPDAIIEGKQSRGERYLEGLRSVYE